MVVDIEVCNKETMGISSNSVVNCCGFVVQQVRNNPQQIEQVEFELQEVHILLKFIHISTSE